MTEMQEGRVTTATVLFCDLVGSTAQRTTLGDDAADRLALGLDRLLRAAVANHRGIIVKSTGDGLMALFDAASDALSAAVTVHQETDRHNRQVTELEHLVLRIGISAGDVHFVAHDCHGTPVVEAARLEAAAEPGSIFVSGLVRSLAGSRGGHGFEPVGLLTLKGLPEPIETFRVPWVPALDPEERAPELVPDASGSTRIPLPGRLVVQPGVGMIGYESELEVMSAALKRVAAGDGREILLIAGEAGMGKTTLAAEAARAAFDGGACVLFGHCEEDLATPYQLFAEALGHYVTHASDDVVYAHVSAHGSELARLVPVLATRIPNLQPSKATDPDTERFLLFAATVGLLAAGSQHRPIVLVLDDLQWADKASLLLLVHLAAAELANRVLVIGTFRDSELAHAHALRETLGSLRRHRGVHRIDLGGLDDAGVVALMQAVAGYSLSDEEVGLAHAVYRETDGNPFFVNQVLRHLVETGAIYQDTSGRWVAEGSFEQMALPDSVREVIGGRVVRLGETAERVLALASVIGRDFDLELLSRASTTPTDEVVDLLDSAAAAALVRETADEPGHYNFSHALIQHTLYEDLGPTRRARAHRQVAEALEELCGGRPGIRVGELARHWTRATQPTDLSKAIEYSRQAGDAALTGLAPSDALRYYTHAQDLLLQTDTPDPILAVDLAIGLGTAQRQVGDAAYRDTLLGAARKALELDDTPRLVAAALANDRGFFSNFGAIDTEKVAILEEALARLSPEDSDRALILAIYCLEIAVGSPLEPRQKLAEEALAIAEAAGDDAVIVRVLNNLAYPLMVPPMLDRSLARTADAIVRAERVGDPVQKFFAAHWRSQVAAQAGDIVEMNQYIEIARSYADGLDQPMLSWVCTFDRAWRAIIEGDCDDAERIAGEAHEIGLEGGQPDATFIFGAQLMMVYHQRGNFDALTPLMEDMASSTPSVAGVLSGALAIACMEAGRVDEARRRLAAFAGDGFELQMNAVWITGMIFYSDAAIELGDPVFAAPLFERLAPWSDQWSNSGATAENPVCHYLGGLAAVLGRFDEADAFFAQSAAMCEAIGAKFFLATTNLHWGRALAQRGAVGDAAKARNLLERARDASRMHGYASVQQRTDTALELLAGSG